MLSFSQFLSEAVHENGIMHIEHPSDRTFDSHEAAHHAIQTLRGVLHGKTPITRKIDDKMSFHAIRTADGKIGVKYKGPGSHYSFSPDEIDRQHGHKPYLAGPLKALHAHLHKVLPKKPGEYQGGYMSEPHTREVVGGHVTHTPNTIEYRTPVKGKEGKKLLRSKVSATIHTELKGERKEAHPILDMSHFGSHPDVHIVPHVVASNERNLHPNTHQTVDAHLTQAEKLMAKHQYHHLAGHETNLRSYINKTVTSGKKPTIQGYKAHLQATHQKKIDAVKTAATKERKTAAMHNDLAHVDANKKHFTRSLAIHHHLQQATNHLARGLDNSIGGAGFHTRINGKDAGGEGYVANGLKVVDREGFSKANRERSEILRANRGKTFTITSHRGE